MKRTKKSLCLLVGLLVVGVISGPQLSVKTDLFSKEEVADHQAVTPVESVVRHVKLQRTYYYQYSKDMSAAIKQAFQRAVSVYQATGIVDLKPGLAPKGQNQVTFSVYSKKKAAGTDTVEFGHGGIGLTPSFINGPKLVNHGRAQLNLVYVGELSPAVAVHELGHALGLAHSENVDSVMYPMENGQIRLTEHDLKALQRIYY